MDEEGSFGERKCIECGKCTYSCPVSHTGGDFSPRKVMEETAVLGRAPSNSGLWQCMNCGMCTEVCQNGVRFHDYVRTVRRDLRARLAPEQNHGGIPDALMRLSALPNLSPRKAGWVSKGLMLDEASDVLLFVGCTPYFDVIFRYLRDDLLEIPRSAVSLLNAMRIRPKLLPEERCCGHDAYWLGDSEMFERLALMNIEAIEKAKVSQVVTFCPECYSTLKNLYPKAAGPLGFEVRSMAEIMAEAIGSGELELGSDQEVLTYHDPCRLGRHAGVYEQPRQVIRSLGRLNEMTRSGPLGVCCGVSAWVNCGALTRGWQLERLKEAEETGAKRLVTACPKCLIHLTCAMSEKVQLLPWPKLPVTDLHVLAASRLRK